VHEPSTSIDRLSAPVADPQPPTQFGASEDPFSSWGWGWGPSTTPNIDAATPDIAQLAQVPVQPEPNAISTLPNTEPTTPQFATNNPAFSVPTSFAQVAASPTTAINDDTTPYDSAAIGSAATIESLAGAGVSTEVVGQPQGTSVEDFWALPFASSIDEEPLPRNKRGEKKLIYVEVAGIVVGLLVLVYLLITFVA